nr:39S ribosomal protein L34, mitochondrial-like [Desmodus rotundus]
MTMAVLRMISSAICLLCPVSSSVAIQGVRWLQPQAFLGLPHLGLPTIQPSRGKVRRNEYQLSNIRQMHKRGWIKHLGTPAGVQVILYHLLKGCKTLSY